MLSTTERRLATGAGVAQALVVVAAVTGLVIGVGGGAEGGDELVADGATGQDFSDEPTLDDLFGEGVVPGDRSDVDPELAPELGPGPVPEPSGSPRPLDDPLPQAEGNLNRPGGTGGLVLPEPRTRPPAQPRRPGTGGTGAGAQQPQGGAQQPQGGGATQPQPQGGTTQQQQPQGGGGGQQGSGQQQPARPPLEPPSSARSTGCPPPGLLGGLGDVNDDRPRVCVRNDTGRQIDVVVNDTRVMDVRPGESRPVTVLDRSADEATATPDLAPSCSGGRAGNLFERGGRYDLVVSASSATCPSDDRLRRPAVAVREL